MGAEINQSRKFQVEFWLFLSGIITLAGGSFGTLMFFIAVATAMIFRLSGNEEARAISLNDTGRFIVWASVLFFVIITLTGFLAGPRDEAFAYMVSYIHWLFPGILALHFARFSNMRELLKWFVVGCRYGVILALVFGIGQYLMHGGRVWATSDNPLIYAHLCLTAGAISFLKFDDDAGFHKFLRYASLVAGLACVALSQSRGALLMVVPILGILVLYQIKHSRMNFRTVVISLIAFGIFAVGAGALLNQRLIHEGAPELSEQLNIERLQSDRSISERSAILASAVVAIQQNPLLGVGVQNTVRAAEKASNLALETPREFGKSHVHNDYLNHQLGSGILGLILFVVLLCSPMLAGWKSEGGPNQREVQFFGIIFSASFGGFALFNLVFHHDLTQTFFVLGLSLLLSGQVRQARVQR